MWRVENGQSPATHRYQSHSSRRETLYDSTLLDLALLDVKGRVLPPQVSVSAHRPSKHFNPLQIVVI